jgi:hypothetical protein
MPCDKASTSVYLSFGSFYIPNWMNFNKMPAVWLTAILALCCISTAPCQESDFGTRFGEAIKLSEENEQNMAFQIWTSLAKDKPENGNVNYRAGVAHLKAASDRTAALPYLKTAVSIGISDNFDPFSPREEKAPVEAYYYLGKAYHLNYKLDDAIESYSMFLKESSPKHHLSANAQLGIVQARNAKKLIKSPVDYEITNLGKVINSEYPEFSPVISVDENALFFTASRIRPDSSNIGLRDRITGEYFNDIYVSYKNRAGEWQTPELLEINETEHTATVNVSADGQILYMYRDDEGVGNIYESKLVGETWSEPIKMGGGINSNAWDTHIAVSIDGQMAFFVSNRSGGLGGRDVYRVRKLPDGQWSAAQNLGGQINTPHEEDAVFISPDGQTLYFSSEGHNSMGGFDIFSSVYNEADDSWGPPQNVGYPINTVDDDVFFVTSADAQRGYYSSFKESGFGEKDIYMVQLPSERLVQLALLMGKIFTADYSKVPRGITIDVTNQQTSMTEIYTPRSRDGGFVAILPPCYPYLIEYKLSGIVLATDTFSIDCESGYQEIRKELILNSLRIEADGTASIVSGDDAGLIVNATTADLMPATFKRYFGYNEHAVALEEEVFQNFMEQVKRLSESKNEVKIEVMGSASKVPTKSFGNNEKLAKLRADDAVKRIKDHAQKMGIDASKLNFIEVNHKVDGPAYRGDYKAGFENYRKFQFIDIRAL